MAHVTTFHDLLMTYSDDILTTPKTNGKDILTTPMTDGEDTLTTPFTTHDYLVTNRHEISDDSSDEIDDRYDIHCIHDRDQVTKRTTR